MTEKLWNKPDRPVVLASKSPRRRDVMKSMGFDFTIHTPSVKNENEHLSGDNINESIKKLALLKTEHTSLKNRSSLVLGADTVVFTEDRYIIGKPSDKKDAFNVLKKLSGTDHQVLTGIALKCIETGFSATSIAKTKVTFRNISDTEINSYLLENEYIDKAGAYAIQGKAMSFVKSINGCYYNIVGLPVFETIMLFKKYIQRKER